MKRSRSGTASSDSRPTGSTLLLIAALAVVLAFAGSFIFGLRGGTAGRERVVTTDTTAGLAVAPAPRGRVEVLNAGGKAGLARVATQQLRDAGFDVVQFGNAGSSEASSRVIDRVGRDSLAAQAARVLGIANVTSAVDTTRYVDVTVILGKDWPPSPAHQRD